MPARTARMLEGGKVIVPIELRKKLGFERGSTVVFEEDENGIRMRSLAETVKRIQDLAAPYRTATLASDELIADRRRES